MKVQYAVGVVITVAVLVVSAVLARGQGPTVPAMPGWPPHPSAVFNYVGSGSLPPWQTHVLTTVPLDRWLIITDARLFIDTDHYYELRENPLIGTNTVKTNHRIGDFAGSPVGMVFAPGSQVELTVNGGSLGYDKRNARLVGYYAR